MSSPYGEDIAVLKEQMNKTVLPALGRIEAKQDLAMATYATKSELRTFKWITVPLVILLTAVLSALVIYYLSNGKDVTPQTTVTTSNTATPASGGTPASTSSTTSTSNTTNTPPSSTPSSTPSSSNSGGLLNNLPLVGGN